MRAIRFLSSSRAAPRRGAVVVLLALMVVVLLGMVAFAVDVGYIVNVQTELRRTCDASALAGASLLVDGTVPAEAEVLKFVDLNPVGGSELETHEIAVEFGNWDDQTQSFQSTADTPSAVRVRLEQNDQPFFFGRVFGQETFDVEAEAIAMYQPRDILLVLDFSGSMNDDSTLAAIGRLGRAAVEANNLQIYQELGSPTYGAMSYTPQYISSTTNSTILNTLGLTSVPYPFPGGSWNDFVNYVKSDSSVNSAGYRRRYGYLTWVDYLLVKRPMASETPTLYQTSEQPVTALKEGVDVFISFLQEADTNDRVGLSIYNSNNGNAVLESPLTPNLSTISTITWQRQAGHYDIWTNIGAGLQTARLELQNNARVGAFKLVVLMTDGVANRPTNAATAATLLRSEAALCAAGNIPVVTISLGSGADTSIMQEVADTTNGVHFNVPGGQTVQQMEDDLKDVFRSIADQRPLKLVK